MGHPATGEEVAVVRDVQLNEKGGIEWVEGGGVRWIWLALLYLMLLRASDTFAEDDGRVHAVHCLIGDNAAFYTGGRQVEGGSSPRVDFVQILQIFRTRVWKSHRTN